MELEVEKILKEKGIKYKILELSGKVITHEDVKRYSNEDPEDDCKTILAKDKKANLYAFFLRGMMRIDFSKIKEITGKISILSQEQMKKITGFEPGEVCPFLLEKFKIFIDKRIFDREKIQFGSGDAKFGLEIATKDLDKIIKFEIADFAQE
jgi:Cys-tRNA(Pro)/Cys-tRNA(Cys) deacylase